MEALRYLEKRNLALPILDRGWWKEGGIEISIDT